MDYKSAIEYLNNSYGVAYKHNLDILKEILYNINNHEPHKKLKIIHVAGTNGKGSTCAMIRHILTKAGFKTGMFISPHLEKVNERLSIDGENISDAELSENISAVKNASRAYFARIQQEEIDSLAFFEIITLAGFNYFYENNVDFVVMEVGLGGRLDATNITQAPILSVITSISLDHTQYLGNSIEEIAAEKSGIIKENCPVVLYLQSDKVYNIVKNICEEKNSFLYYDKSKEVEVLSESLEETRFSVESKAYGYCYHDLKLKLLGEYQLYNACNVLLIIHALQSIGICINESHVRSGLFETKWPGRMEIIGYNPFILLDGAHNADGVSKLAESVLKHFPDIKTTMIIGILKDKDYCEMINKMAHIAHQIVLTKPDYGKRNLDLTQLFECIDDKNKQICFEEDFKQAFNLARKITAPNGMICCAGSLYLVGNIRKYALEVL